MFALGNEALPRDLSPLAMSDGLSVFDDRRIGYRQHFYSQGALSIGYVHRYTAFGRLNDVRHMRNVWADKYPWRILCHDQLVNRRRQLLEKCVLVALFPGTAPVYISRPVRPVNMRIGIFGLFISVPIVCLLYLDEDFSIYPPIVL